MHRFICENINLLFCWLLVTNITHLYEVCQVLNAVIIVNGVELRVCVILPDTGNNIRIDIVRGSWGSGGIAFTIPPLPLIMCNCVTSN
jgi:hypothetical protein